MLCNAMWCYVMLFNVMYVYTCMSCVCDCVCVCLSCIFDSTTFYIHQSTASTLGESSAGTVFPVFPVFPASSRTMTARVSLPTETSWPTLKSPLLRRVSGLSKLFRKSWAEMGALGMLSVYNGSVFKCVQPPWDSMTMTKTYSKERPTGQTLRSHAQLEAKRCHKVWSGKQI